MAHADYSCCAICDCKMNYGEERTKESFCERCHVILFDIGIGPTVKHFMDVLTSMPDDAASQFLDLVGFRPCYYENAVDSALINRGLVVTDCKEDTPFGQGPKWGKILRSKCTCVRAPSLNTKEGK